MILVTPAGTTKLPEELNVWTVGVSVTGPIVFNESDVAFVVVHETVADWPALMTLGVIFTVQVGPGVTGHESVPDAGVVL